MLSEKSSVTSSTNKRTSSGIFFQNACDLLRLRPLYNGYKTSLASMGFFVGQYGVHLTGRQTRFIYAQMSAHVLWNYYPVLGMACVLPGLESADSFLV